MEQKATEEFIAIYNRLDAYMRQTLKVDRFIEHSTLLREMAQKNRVFQDYLQDLRMFAEMRNMMVHNPYKKDADPLIHPHAYILKKYAQILDLVLHPPKALSVAVLGTKIFTAKLSTNAHHLMQTMVEKNYTHVPIMENGEMMGIFSENSLLSYLVANKEGLILPDTTVGDFKKFIKVENHLNEAFEFVPRGALLTDVETIFRKGMIEGKRISVVYVTEHGSKHEKLLGMITPWDLTNIRNPKQS